MADNIIDHIQVGDNTFTIKDTTYSTATQSNDGIMSSTDKKKLDDIDLSTYALKSDVNTFTGIPYSGGNECNLSLGYEGGPMYVNYRGVDGSGITDYYMGQGLKDYSVANIHAKNFIIDDKTSLLDVFNNQMTAVDSENDAVPEYNGCKVFRVTSTTSGGAGGYILSIRWLDSEYITQIFIDADPTKMISIRHKNPSGWDDWSKFVNQSNISEFITVSNNTLVI